MSTIEQGDSGIKVIICFGTKFKLEVEFTAIQSDNFGIFCLFDLILYVPVNNFSVMLGRVFLG